jgi:hypothetical protein
LTYGKPSKISNYILFRKACARNINQIKFAYEKRCMDLYCFYLEKTCLIDISKLILNKFSENIHGENTPLMRALFYNEPTAT